MYKIVPKKKEKMKIPPKNVAGLLKTRVFPTPSAASFLVTEKRKALAQSAIELTTKESWFHQKRLNE